MKLLIVIHNFPPYSVGGSELYTYRLCRDLAIEHEVTVFHQFRDRTKKAYHIDRCSVDGMRIVTVNTFNRQPQGFLGSYADGRIPKIFKELLEELKPDIVHCHHLTNLSVSILDVAAEAGIPLIYEVHDHWLRCPRGQLVRRDLNLCEKATPKDCVACLAPDLRLNPAFRIYPRWLASGGVRLATREWGRRLLGLLSAWHASLIVRFEPESIRKIRHREAFIRNSVSKVDRLIAYTPYMKKVLQSLGVPASRIIVSNHGYCHDAVRPISPVTSRRFRFVFLGTLLPSKGAHILIRAFRKLPPGSELHLYGAENHYPGFPGYERFLRKLAANAAVSFHGAYEHYTLPAIMSRTDAVVVPSLWHEGGPTTLLEGMIAGKPVLASATCDGFVDHIKDRGYGFIHEPGNVPQLARQMKEVAASPVKPPPFKWKGISDDVVFLEKLYGDMSREKNPVSSHS